MEVKAETLVTSDLGRRGEEDERKGKTDRSGISSAAPGLWVLIEIY